MGNIIEQKNCKKCNESFSIEKEDKVFYDKIGVPFPTLCSECRRQRRLSFRNERKLYKRTCDFSKKNIISNISQDKPFKVYENEIWFSDKWDPMDYGRKFNFKDSFFEQYYELFKEVPQIALIVSSCQNCDYTNYSWENKNCYLVFDAGVSEDSLYCQTLYFSKYVMDSLYIRDNTELCYDSLNCSKCYNIKSCNQCYNSSNLSFCFDMRGCSDCFMSSNFRNKKYCFRNQQLSEVDYKDKIKSINTGDREEYNKYKTQYYELIKKSLHVSNYLVNSEQCSGDFVMNSKNCKHCFNIERSEDCKYCFDSADPGSKDSYDDDRSGWNGELLYETIGLPKPYNTHFSVSCGYPRNLDYCYFCNNCEDCFGCVSLKNKKYCILNKQYSKEEYFKLKTKIIEQMRKYNEWGEFFPSKISPFAYNETLAQDYFTTSKDQAILDGYRWRDDDEKTYVEQTYKLPNDIKEVEEDILHEILVCDCCQKNYRIVPQELKLLKNMTLPVPIGCPECRNNERKRLMNPMRLWKSNCTKCNKGIETSYAPNREEKVYCEKCYMEELY